ncbi:preprotein translocase subunit SecG [Desulfomonile tiedjei]|uniref:Protein-export membrane protein SecG n=1 Tax=Desulfomonile tiedjei (strain ATCC 49306 / DSM 6799 / DCB-1) TaxID=706587 RepID=I4BZR3_DESTA|nr:preprotein translocase subunit SecG [Desulfomonile tiedjei]AFM22804.1 protein translocase subunit secG [Desulfomonile tiedjei DSM 6799]
MLTMFILIVHVVVCIALIMIILLQSGKGADIGATFGGGSSQTVFGSSGAGTFLSKITIGAAVVFMVTSIFLTYFSGKATLIQERSIVSEESGAPSAVPPTGTPETPGSGAPPTQSEAPQSAPPAMPQAPSGGSPAPASPQPSGETPPAK